MEPNYQALRRAMVERQIKQRGILDPSILAAFLEVPRHLFVPDPYKSHAYEDHPLGIGEGQTISQPYIVALMIQAAQVTSKSKVLEIGTGSGYAAAVLSRLVKEVDTIERIPELANRAEAIIKQLQYNNVHISTGDGTLGLPGKAPFDAIIATAASPAIPQTLIHQLSSGGRLIIPVGDATSQQLMRLSKIDDNQFSREILEWVRFVPLIGKEGWNLENEFHDTP